ncbi:PAS domain-containing protein [Echinicola sp. CAU 1574]|uniref:PAS domain-containing protein n=1 Tax=Echinicola arenosa TaxID=2774144 RepID=A0ABR9AGG8_9BACT|nr:PAS domain-containing protein [Echinicola arenosa]MBD8487382.1 PAS domain-containing protein [Echinicola arenosa]
MFFRKKYKITFKPAPLKSWDIYVQSIFQKPIKTLSEQDFNTLTYYKNKFNWASKLDMLSSNYDALVLTNLNEEIIWVNHGFKKMTGYGPHFAKGKKPTFLQGDDTSKLALAGIKRKLGSKKVFTTKVLNYKKDQSHYLCEITIFPLLDHHQKVSHFLALEKEI